MSWRCPRCGQVEPAFREQPSGPVSCPKCGQRVDKPPATPGPAAEAPPSGGSRTETPFDLLDLGSLDRSDVVSLPTPVGQARGPKLPAVPSPSVEARGSGPPVSEGRQPPSGGGPPAFPTSAAGANDPPRPLDVNDLDFRDPVEALADDALSERLAVESDPLEILDDEALFRSLDVEGYDVPGAGSSAPGFADDAATRETTPNYSMVSVRCRVCDTLQYVETRPGSQTLCDICFTPLPIPGTDAGSGDHPNRLARGPAASKTFSPEAIGEVAAPGTDPAGDDEVDALIHNVEGATGEAFVVPKVEPGNDLAAASMGMSKGASDPAGGSDELRLVPLDEAADPRSLDLLLLEDETKDLLRDRAAIAEEVSEEELVPLDGDISTEELDAVLDEAIAEVTAERPAAKPPARPPSFAPANPLPNLGSAANLAAAAGPGPGATSTAASGIGASAPWHPSRSGSIDAASDQDARGDGPWWRDLLAPFCSPWLVGGGVLMILLVYWLQISWRLAWDEGTFWQQLIGFFSGIFAALLTFPLWLAFLGVIANRQLGLGQAGRLSLPALGAQTLQFAIVLVLALPGAALGTPTMNSVVIGCLAAFTMLPLGLYFVTSAIAAEELFCYYEPRVVKSLRQDGAHWMLGFVIVGLMLTLGIPLAIITSYAAWIGCVVFAAFAVPASMIYAAVIGRLAARAMPDQTSGSKD